MSAKQCTICCNDVSDSNIVKCPKCSEEACVKCYKKVMYSSTENAQCLFPSCKTYFSLEFLIKTFGRDYIWSNKKGNYREHRENMLLDQQLVLLPQTQLIIEREKMVKELEILYNKKNENLYIDFTRQKRVLEIELSQKRNILLNPGINTTVDDLDLDLDVDPDDEKYHKNDIRCACPVADCKGFINRKWICGICSTKICKNCMEPLDKVKEHVCNEDSVKNVIEIKKSTKQCPTCKAYVFKIFGCYQMFCTNCKTFFDWTSLKVIEKTAFVHNPHYTEWLQNGGQANDMIMNNGPQCTISYDRIQNLKCLDPKKISQKFKDDISIMLLKGHKGHKVDNFLISVKKTLIRFHEAQNNIRQESNVDLEGQLNHKLGLMRREYILSKDRITKSKYKIEIQKIHKKFQKESEYKDIQIALYEYFNSALNLCIQELEKDNVLEDWLLIDILNTFVERVVKYYKYSLESVSKMFRLYGSIAKISVDSWGYMHSAIDSLKQIHTPVLTEIKVESVAETAAKIAATIAAVEVQLKKTEIMSDK